MDVLASSTCPCIIGVAHGLLATTPPPSSSPNAGTSIRWFHANRPTNPNRCSFAPTRVRLCWRRSGSDVVRVRKVKVLGHVHLTEYREQPLLLDEVVGFVVERHREHVCTL